MRAIASAVAIQPNAAGFSCYDPTLAERLRQAAAQAEQPAELKLREAVFNEGPAGVANAVKNLWRNIGAYSTSLATLRVLRRQRAAGRTDSGEPITGRDLIALLATIGIDLGLLALAIVNPPREGAVAAPFGPLRPADQRGDRARAIAARGRRDREWVRGHFIHHNRASYLVIPNLYSADHETTKKESRPRALAMNQLAGVLSDLDLVRWPKRGRWWLAAEERAGAAEGRGERRAATPT